MTREASSPPHSSSLYCSRCIFEWGQFQASSVFSRSIIFVFFIFPHICSSRIVLNVVRSCYQFKIWVAAHPKSNQAKLLCCNFSHVTVHRERSYRSIGKISHLEFDRQDPLVWGKWYFDKCTDQLFWDPSTFTFSTSCAAVMRKAFETEVENDVKREGAGGADL